MALVKPFKALRPKSAYAEKIAALPYDVYSSEEARELVKDNPYSFLHVDKPEIDLDNNVDLYSSNVYEKAAENLNKLIEDDQLVKDADEALYVYRLEMDGRIQTGLAALTSIDEYINGVIKRHELTRQEKEMDRTEHIKYCKAHTGPIFLTYKSNLSIKYVLCDWAVNNEPVYDFISDDGTRHTVWIIDNKAVINALVNAFSEVNSFYIADGHHRNAAAVKTGLEMRKNNKVHTGNEEYNYYLSVIFPDDELHIMDYNRVIKDLNGLSDKEFISKLSGNFNIEEYGRPFKPEKRHEFGMYLGGIWYKLTAAPGLVNEDDALKSLDVSILHDYIIAPVLNITDIRNDNRIDFIGGIRGISEISRRIDSGEMKVGFSMYPTSLSELITVAEDGGIMPPKSTWFEPKLRSGLLIHQI